MENTKVEKEKLIITKQRIKKAFVMIYKDVLKQHKGHPCCMMALKEVFDIVVAVSEQIEETLKKPSEEEI